MFPYQLIKCELLTSAFGESRVHETVRQLRDADYFPPHEHVTVNDLCVLIYCLSCCNKVRETKEYLSKYFLLKSTDGTMLSNVFISIMSNNILMECLDEICFFKESGKVAMVFKYTPDQAVLFTHADNTPDTGISSYTLINGKWWRELKAFATKSNLEITATQNIN